MKSPLNWFGGKDRLTRNILPFPDHTVYLEVFGGGASVLLRKTPSPREVYNDVNDRLVNFWRVLQKHWLYLKFRAETDIDGRQLFEEYRDDPTDNQLENAYRFFYVNRHSYASKGATYQGITFSNNKSCYRRVYMKDINMLEKIHDRIKEIKFENQDFAYLMDRCIKRYDDEQMLFYLDPPYFESGDEYEKGAGGKEWSEDRFLELKEILESLDKALFVLSIDSKDYFSNKDWYYEEVVRHNVAGTANGSVKDKVEYIVRNFNPLKTEVMPSGGNAVEI